MSSETDIRPFQVDMPDEAIADLRQRIAAARWPSRELVADRSQACSWPRSRNSPVTG
jgi:hypothetical protein